MSDLDRNGSEAAGATGPAVRRSRAETSLGMAKPRPDGRPAFTEVEVTAGVASLLWIIVVTLILVFARTEESVTGGTTGFDGLRFVMTIIAVFLPVALIWVAATTVRWARVMQDEGKRLQAAVDAIRHGHISPGTAGTGAKPSLERRVEELSRAQRRSDEILSELAAALDERRTGLRHDSAGSAAAGTTLEASAGSGPAEQDAASSTGSAYGGEQAAAGPGVEPLPADVLISALNFPESPEDAAGFRALRRALNHPSSAQLVQAAQDVLTLLSQDGIYMDDLSPERSHPDLWRRFASGERGGPITDLGGVRDDTVLAQAAGRMRQDTIFRDAMHHFLRKYDQMLTSFISVASDEDLLTLGDTRSGRAFMLLGRVTGTFN